MKPSPTRRNVVLDVETITTDKSIVEISLIDADESVILGRFWQLVHPQDLFIGHNLLEFDLSFVRQRSWVAGLKPSGDLDLGRYYSHDFVDIMHLWSNWESTPRPSLEGMADVIGLRRKTAKALKVSDWWSAGDLDSIAVHCREDIRITYEAFLRLTFQPVPDRY
jgi:predicted PolB exonuclease-like 3'-5' exonuclease